MGGSGEVGCPSYNWTDIYNFEEKDGSRIYSMRHVRRSVQFYKSHKLRFELS